MVTSRVSVMQIFLGLGQLFLGLRDKGDLVGLGLVLLMAALVLSAVITGWYPYLAVAGGHLLAVTFLVSDLSA